MPEAHQDPSSYDKWMVNLNNALGTGFTSSGMAIEILPETDDATVVAASVRMTQEVKKGEYKDAVLRWNVASFVMQMARRSGLLNEDIIEQHHMEDRLGLKAKTILGWITVTKKTPPKLLVPGVTWAVLDALSRPAMPEDAEKAGEIMDAKMKIAMELAADPTSATAAVAKSLLNKRLEEAGEKPPAPPSKLQLLTILACLQRKLRFVTESGDTQEALESVGYKSRGDLVDGIEAAETSCVNLGLIPAKV